MSSRPRLYDIQSGRRVNRRQYAPSLLVNAASWEMECTSEKLSLSPARRWSVREYNSRTHEQYQMSNVGNLAQMQKAVKGAHEEMELNYTTNHAVG